MSMAEIPPEDIEALKTVFEEITFIDDAREAEAIAAIKQAYTERHSQ